METQKRIDISGFAMRLNEVLDDAGFPAKRFGRQTSLAKEFNVSQRGASNWVEGNALPRMAYLQMIALHFTCSIDWLFTGAGHKYPGEGNKISDDIASLKKSDQDIILAMLARLKECGTQSTE